VFVFPTSCRFALRFVPSFVTPARDPRRYSTGSTSVRFRVQYGAALWPHAGGDPLILHSATSDCPAAVNRYRISAPGNSSTRRPPAGARGRCLRPVEQDVLWTINQLDRWPAARPLRGGARTWLPSVRNEFDRIALERRRSRRQVRLADECRDEQSLGLS